MDKHWKGEERAVGALLGGQRCPANSGGKVDVASARYVAQCKHVRVLSLASLESLALEMERIGSEKGKLGLVLIKRRAGRGTPTVRLVCMTEATWRQLVQEQVGSAGQDKPEPGA